MARLTEMQLSVLSNFDTPTVCNAIERFQLRSHTEGFAHPGMVLRTSQTRAMVAYAVTAKLSSWTPATASQKAMMFDYYEDVLKVDVPTVAVMQDIDEVRIGTFWGEVQATTFKALGAIGTITDGGIRDLSDVDALGFYCFSTELMVARAEAHLVERNTPVTIRKLMIHPGDLIHADGHGITVIPHEIAPMLAEACQGICDAEKYVLEPCRKAVAEGQRPGINQIKAWREQMNKRR
ncbi:RraA family protein [Fusibacter paucivorans]|uniref:Putative 4-hydroxy-4-methyl-2-oxoglutarate aldolase n=1 Tax=Fusibacter paucivorans TaxID=76009 RepID=A0ABS5PMG8_9FIRM|nr:RraA family protein [Fusibacter paucivorans]MBS7526374.1 RraA family protein [Fusibacter paucivorans]